MIKTTFHFCICTNVLLVWVCSVRAVEEDGRGGVFKAHSTALTQAHRYEGK